MGIVNRIKTFLFSAGRRFDYSGSTGNVTAATGVTSNLAKFLIGMSDFTTLREEEIYEQMYVWEPEIAAAIVKIGDMCRSSFEYFMLVDDSQLDNVGPVHIENNGDAIDVDPNNGGNLYGEMVDTANLIAPKIGVKDCYEVWASVMYQHGFVVLEKNKDLSLTVLPNDRITFVDDQAHIGGMITEFNYLMMQANYCVIDEQQVTQRVIPRDKFIVIKINDTPVHVTDRFGRQTFGIYPVSPLQRAIVPVWMKRQVQITEVLWRWANVPREHHQIQADAFNLQLYPGTPEQKRTAAEADLRRFITSYSAQLAAQVPDQAYVTSSNVEIKNIEHDQSSYMDSNAFLGQIQDSVWYALNVPKSFVSGESESSYASELIMSSVTGLRIRQIAEKISRVVLENMKERLIAINKQYPIDYLEIKLSFDISESKLEKFKRMQIMGSLGCFTPTEIREEGEYAPLTDSQLSEEGLLAINGEPTMFKKTDLDKMIKLKTTPPVPKAPFGNSGGGASSSTPISKPSSPTTPRSQLKQPTDSAQATINKASK